MTHTKIVHQLTLDPRSEISKRKSKLKRTMTSSSNKLICYIAKRFASDKMFLIGNIDGDTVECVTDKNDWKICLLTELVNCRDGIQFVDNLTYDDIVLMIHEICTV